MKSLKRLLFRKLFPEEFNYQNFCYDKWVESASQLNNLKKENRSFLDLMDIMDYIFSRGFDIIGIEESRAGKLVVAKDVYGDNLDIHLFTQRYRTVHPKIEGIVKNRSNGFKSVEITGIDMIENSMGNGSIAMDYFLRVAKEMKISNVFGILSEVDKNNFMRSVPYYQKHGFTVVLPKNGLQGHISMVLSDKGECLNMDRIYLDKLNIEYFKNCINDIITQLDEEAISAEDSIEKLETIYKHTVGLRDTFFIFSITGIEELLKPIKDKIEYYKSQQLEQ